MVDLYDYQITLISCSRWTHKMDTWQLFLHKHLFEIHLCIKYHFCIYGHTHTHTHTYIYNIYIYISYETGYGYIHCFNILLYGNVESNK